MTNAEIVIGSIKTVISGELITNPPLLNESDYAEIFKIARSHDMLPMVSEGLYKNNLLPDNEIGNAFKLAQMSSIVRLSRFEQVRNTISCSLHKANIPYLFLKGSVLKEYYPDAYMRTQCDIDVLVRRLDLPKAEEVFLENGYTKTSIEHHEVSFFSQSGVHIELHFFLEEEHNQTIDKALLTVWDNVYSETSRPYHFYMNRDFFLFYHVAHMEKHFSNGGCGIKPFIDLWIIKYRMGICVDEGKDFLESCNLLNFYYHMEHLSEVWFGNMTHTEISKKVENYILNAGVYGTQENNAAMAQCRKGSKSKHLAERIFLPYETISRYYPIVKKCPIILPFAHIYRWCKVLFGKGRERALNEVNVNLSITEEKRREIMDLYKELQL